MRVRVKVGVRVTCPSRATLPLREASTSRAAPRLASSAAPRSPSPPSPPVTSQVPSTLTRPARPAAAVSATPRCSRAACATPPDHASSSSADGVEASTPPAAASSASAHSTCACGISRRSTRATPHVPPSAAPRMPWLGCASRLGACAPRVRSTRLRAWKGCGLWFGFGLG